ncbi:5-formyltetrahydrofolate cyclo-ligase [Oceanobacillus jeddahense]|uniref:5-formyltetrahydrofolate cyclo-ligase n=1 Tax=Oceanobacillus jeddahense TaxID=1462527 RepID=UPI000595DE71|nr:5-formyltetrahydrofolate cyclo-ligase [Oceanobacillus jeddahense]
MSEKKILRQKMLKYLSGLPEHEKKEMAEKLQKKLYTSPLFQKAETIGITISTDIEWNTYEIIEKAREEGKKIASPKCIVKTKEMQYYVWDQQDQIQVGYAGIKEPIPEKATPIAANDIDLLLVPGIIFDKSGYRIGYGGGYYDRMLADYTGTTLSLCIEKQIVDQIPREHYDLPVEQLITEKRMIKIPK